jgi:uncharacterized protein
MEETVAQMQWHPNITVSTEGTTALLSKAPRKFLEIIGTLMMNGFTDRILWAIGGLVVHSRWFEEAFWNLQMPRDLVEGYGFPELTEEAKRKIFGLNAARLLQISDEQVNKVIVSDEYGKPRRLKEPYSALRRNHA